MKNYYEGYALAMPDGKTYMLTKPEELEIPEPKPEPWRPPEGEIALYGDGISFDASYKPNVRAYFNHGNSWRDTEQAREAAEAQRFWNWLYQLAIHVNPSGKAGGKYEVFWSDVEEKWKTALCPAISMYTGGIFETQAAMVKASDIMNADPDNWQPPAYMLREVGDE